MQTVAPPLPKLPAIGHEAVAAPVLRALRLLAQAGREIGGAVI